MKRTPKRHFYLALCAHEGWSKRTLRAKMDGKLYERTIAARGSTDELEAELSALRANGVTTPTLAFRDPYVQAALRLGTVSRESIARMTEMGAAMSGKEPNFGRIRLYNIVMGFFHAAQGVIVVALANSFALPVTATFLAGPPGTPPPAPTTLFEVPVGWAVAAFLFMSAAAHFTVSAPGVFPWYVRNLKINRNYARWIEYSFSSSLMVILIAMLTGLFDVAALIAIFGANAAMNLFGLLMEKYEEPGNTNWISFVFGCVVGLAPWVGVGIYLWSPGTAANPPTFVYWIFVILFVFFNSFAINMVLQYKKVGPWRSYLFGESSYILLSLTAKSLLAWMIFANTLVAS